MVRARAGRHGAGMLAALGLFVFETDSALFASLRRERDWRHESTERFGARAAFQFTGPGEDRITLTGSLVPELLGSYSAMETLAAMADQGDAFTLMDGGGHVVGSFVVARISEDKGNLVDNGAARRNDFSIELVRVD